jgi:hypothetical protein
MIGIQIVPKHFSEEKNLQPELNRRNYVWEDTQYVHLRALLFIQNQLKKLHFVRNIQ